MLDQYEQLIEATRLAGRVPWAFEAYWYKLGNYRGLGGGLGEFGRGQRILRGFLPASGDLKGFGTGLSPWWQSLGLNDLGLMARSLGRLREAAMIRREHD